MITDKVRAHHLARKALLNVRQSSAHPGFAQPRSTALQYAMRDRLTALGWSEIEVMMTTLVVLLPTVSSAPASSGKFH
jgi:hypothetical protein